MNRTVMVIVTWNAHGFFTGSLNNFPFSVDVSDFCRSFKIESKTADKFYIDHEVFMNEVSNVIERNSALQIFTTLTLKHFLDVK